MNTKEIHSNEATGIASVESVDMKLEVIRMSCGGRTAKARCALRTPPPCRVACFRIPTSSLSVLSCLTVIRDQPRTEHISEMETSRQHGFVKRYGLVRDDRHEAPPVIEHFRRSLAKPFAVLPHHRLGVLPLGSP